MPYLTKSKIMAYRQCPKRLWLEIHKPELRDDSGAQMAFAAGNQVGAAARQAFDLDGKGTLVDVETLGHVEAIEETKRLLAEGAGPIFEAGISAVGGLAYADVMLPDRTDGVLRWRMIEVKSSTSVKDYQRDDIAVQAYLAKEAGIPLVSASLAYINRDFSYSGRAGYQGLFKLVELGDEAAERHEEVKAWFTKAHEVADQEVEPEIETGDQCYSPFSCGFLSYCNRNKVSPDYPLSSLPRLRQIRREAIENTGVDDLREAPDHLLNDLQKRVKHCSATGEVFFQADAAAAKLAPYGYPARFLDFETITFAVPRLEYTRPYEQIPFQFSLHTLQSDERLIHNGLMHHEFLDLSGNNPSDECALELVRLCGSEGPIYAYNAGFEAKVIRDMANSHSDEIGEALRSIEARLVDLLPIARHHYYHPIQHGSWSLKAVLPAICPDLSYSELEGVQDGTMAQTAYLEAIDPATSAERKETLRRQLHDYCRLDTLALVRLYYFFKGDPFDDYYTYTQV